MNRIASPGIKFILLSSLLFFVFSCSTDKENVLNQNQEITSVEVKTIIQVDDLSSVADDVITEIFQENVSGKITSKNNDCYEINFSDTGYTIVFTNCELEGIADIVNGTLTVTNIADEETTAFTATYINFMVGDVEINGTRNFTVNTSSGTNSVSFTIISDMTITLENGVLIQESGSKIFAIIFDLEDINNSGLTIEGNWTVNIDNDTYLIDVTSALQTNFNCVYISKGAMDVNKNSAQFSIDFGDGTCDTIADLLNPDGTIEEISFKD